MSEFSGTVAKPKMAPGRATIGAMQDYGYTTQEIIEWKQNRTKEFLDFGYTPQEIDGYWGETEPDLAPAQQVLSTNLAKVPPEGRQKLATSTTDFLAAGWGTSNVGLLWDGKPETITPQHATIPQRILGAAGQAAGDAPLIVPGAIIGWKGGAALGATIGTLGGPPGIAIGATIGGLVGASVGAAVLPEALREVQLHYYNNTNVSTVSDFVTVLGASSVKVGKVGLAAAVSAPVGLAAGLGAGIVVNRAVGATTGSLVGKVAGHSTDAVTQAVTYAGVLGGLEGKIPDAEDFISGMVIALAARGAQASFATGKYAYKNRPGADEVLPPEPAPPSPGGPGVGRGQTIDGDFSVVSDQPAQQLALPGPRTLPEAIQRGEKNLQQIYVQTGIHPKEAAELSLTDPVLRQEIMQQDILGEPVLDKFLTIAKAEPEPYVQPAEGGNGGLPPPKGTDGEITEPPSGPKKIDGDVEPLKSAQEINQEILSKVVDIPTKASLLSPAKLYRDWVSELHPAIKIDEALASEGKIDLDTQLGVENLLRETYGSGTRAMHFVKFGVINAKGDKISDASIERALTVASERGPPIEYVAHMIAKRTVDQSKRGIDTGFNLEDSMRLLELNGTKYKAAEQIWSEVTRGALDYAVAKNLYGREDALFMTEAGFYIAMRRAMGETQPMPQRGNKGFKVSQPLRTMTGSDLDVVDPVIMTIDSIKQTIKMADRNQAVLDAVELLEKADLAEYTGLKKASSKEVSTLVKRVKATIAEPGSNEFNPYLSQDVLDIPAHAVERVKRTGLLKENQVLFMREGVPQLYTVDDPMLANLLNKVGSKQEAEVLTTWFQKLASWNRAGVVSAPTFGIRTGILSQLAAFVLDPTHPPPFVRAAGALIDAFTDGPRFQELMAKGGLTSIIDIDADFTTQALYELMEKHGRFERMWNHLKHPLQAAQIFNYRLEAAQRIGLRDHALAKGLEDRRATVQARIGLLDFSEQGASAAANWMARNIPFFHAGVLANRQVARAAEQHPGSSGAALFGALGTAAIMLYVLNYLQDQKDEKDGGLPENRKYSSIDRKIRNSMFVFPETYGFRLKVQSIPGVHSAFIGGMNALLDYFVRQDKRAFDDFALHVVESFMMPLNHPLITLGIENFSHRDTNTGRPLIPASLEKNSPPMQYTEDTTEVSKAISNIMGKNAMNVIDMSPIMLDNAVKTMAGTAGYALLRAVNAPLNTSGRPWEATDLPFVQSFLVYNPRMGAQPIKDFYAAEKRMSQVIADQKTAIRRLGQGNPNAPTELEIALRQTGIDLGKIKEALTVANSVVIGINNMKTVTPEEHAKLSPTEQKRVMTVDDKRQKSDQMYSWMIGMAINATKFIDQIEKARKQPFDPSLTGVP